MNYISAFLMAFCVACVFIGCLYMLCPDGAISKSVKYILSLVFLLTVISAAGFTVKKAEIDIDFSPPETSTEALDTATAKYVYSYALQKAGIEFEEIEIFTNKAADGSISINKVVIYSASPKDTVMSALGEAAKNIEVEIINE